MSVAPDTKFRRSRLHGSLAEWFGRAPPLRLSSPVEAQFLIAVNIEKMPVATLQEFVALIRAHPGRFNAAAAGVARSSRSGSSDCRTT